MATKEEMYEPYLVVNVCGIPALHSEMREEFPDGKVPDGYMKFELEQSMDLDSPIADWDAYEPVRLCEKADDDKFIGTVLIPVNDYSKERLEAFQDVNVTINYGDTSMWDMVNGREASIAQLDKIRDNNIEFSLLESQFIWNVAKVNEDMAWNPEKAGQNTVLFVYKPVHAQEEGDKLKAGAYEITNAFVFNPEVTKGGIDDLIKGESVFDVADENCVFVGVFAGESSVTCYFQGNSELDKLLPDFIDERKALFESRQLITQFYNETLQFPPSVQWENPRFTSLYGVHEDNKDIFATVDFIDCKIDKSINNEVVFSSGFDSIRDLLEKEIKTLDKDELVYINPSLMEKYDNEHSIKNTLEQKGKEAETINFGHKEGTNKEKIIGDD